VQTGTTVAQMSLRFAGVVQIALGLLFWTGRARNLIPVHMLLGFVLVLALWALAALAARAGVHVGIIAVALVWGVFVALAGTSQAHLPPGYGHWSMQAARLLIALTTIGLGEDLVVRMRRSEWSRGR
jgi:hypothetical protein